MEKREKERMCRLVSLARAGDAHSFSLLYEMVYEDLYRTALYTLGNAHDAEDVVGDTVLDAYAQIDSLRDETAFRSWIFKILANRCKRRIREYVEERERLTTEWTDPELEIAARCAEQADELAQILDRQEIAYAFLSISREDRLLVTMAVYGGYNSRELAKLLHMNRNTVRSRYQRALRKMREALEKR